MILEKINNPKDVQKLTLKEKKILAKEIREFLIDKVSKNGGHLASNLGVVELTIALLSSFDFDEDKIIFDVGHQSYVYKILTGRKDKFDNLRKYKGLRGFPYRKESKYDFFETGHSSTSISAGLGIARARDLKKEKYNVISLIGDGSISNGMSLEALNDIGYNKTKMIIILNDNGMSISSNVGGLSSYFSRISINKRYLKVKNKIKHCMDGTKYGNKIVRTLGRIKDGLRSFLVPSEYFEEMGLTYIGPLDGHDISLLTKVLKRVKTTDKPVIIHVVTKKGKGYLKSEQNPDIYHGVSPFDKEKGVEKSTKESYSSVFGKELTKLGEKNDKVVAVTAAMKDGTGLTPFFDKYPERSFDVGMAEEHAVTFAAGMANEGLIPFVAVYSSFLQRAFDQIVHDVAMQKLHVVFMIDRAGIVGSDGETHQGLLDISYMSLIPNMVVMSPKCKEELAPMMKYASKLDTPVAIRYPRGDDKKSLKPVDQIEKGKWEIVSKGEKTVIIATGKMVELAYRAKEEYKLDSMIVNALFIKPLDEEFLKKIVNEKYNVLTIEDGIIKGGLGSEINRTLNKLGFKGKIEILGFDDKFIEQGTIDELFNQENITTKNIKNIIESLEK